MLSVFPKIKNIMTTQENEMMNRLVVLSCDERRTWEESGVFLKWNKNMKRNRRGRGCAHMQKEIG